MVLGYPVTSRFGDTLKVTRGTVTGLPTPGGENYLLFDAAGNRGNSGGPVCDNTTTVVGILTKSTLDQTYNYTQGIPALVGLTFARKHIPEFSAQPVVSEQLEWPDVDQAVSQSTVLILADKYVIDVGMVGRKPTDEVIPQARERASANAYEDPWCMACNGRGRVDCGIRGCANGSVREFKEEVVNRDPLTGRKIVQRKPVRVPCKTCKGTGKVDCKQCRDGIDSSVQ
jgi:hypothetical protein